MPESYPVRVLVLALDTSTEAVVVGLLDVPATGEPTVLATELRTGARQHGEQLMPAILHAAHAAGRRLDELDAVVCGAGPGPFTGLRVGLVSAAGLGDALGIPVYGVCSLDAIAHVAGPGEPLLVVSDARRREVYWAAYNWAGAGGANRTHGPAVLAPSALARQLGELGARRVAGPVAGQYAELFGLPEQRIGQAPGSAPGSAPGLAPGLAPTPAGLVAPALAQLRSGAAPAPLEPLYLRRPDAVPPGERKRVNA
jgi:tRNA threonylcarbamoyl adenosine modification protein YeaZ